MMPIGWFSVRAAADDSDASGVSAADDVEAVDYVEGAEESEGALSAPQAAMDSARAADRTMEAARRKDFFMDGNPPQNNVYVYGNTPNSIVKKIIQSVNGLQKFRRICQKG